MKRVLALTLSLWLAGCATGNADKPAEPATAPVVEQKPTPKPAPEPASVWAELSPGLRVNRAERLVEFDGFVPIDAHDEETPVVYLETIVCAGDSKEHESLVTTRVRPSDVHAALLLVGLEPGRPGEWGWDGQKMTSTAPTGPALSVELIAGGAASAPEDWIVGVGGEAFVGAGYVFAGSYFKPVGGTERYEADADGVIVGLHTFGSEVVAQERVMSPDSGVEEPEWIASEKTPAYGTPVTVRIRAIE